MMMGYISKYDTKFLTYINRKYRKYKVCFEFFDDYVCWLFYDYFGMNEELYYNQLEKDINEDSDLQTGRERDKRGKINGNWEKD